MIPSKLETFGLTYYEAMAQGVPVVVADRDFAREACGDVGLYGDPSDPGNFADRIVEAIDRREVLGRRAQARAAEHRVEWDEVARLYLDILGEVFGAA